MKMVLAILVVCALSYPNAALARGDHLVVTDPGLIAQVYSGPTKIVVFGNPFRVPWQLAVNRQIVTGTGFTLPTQFTQPFATATNLPATPAPASAPGSTTSTIPTNGHGEIVLDVITNPGAVATNPGHCSDTKTFAKFSGCLTDLEKHLNRLIDGPPFLQGSIGHVVQSVAKAQVEFKALQQRADDALADQRPNLEAEKTLPNAQRAFTCLISARAHGRNCNYRAGATVESVHDSILHILPYPTQELADVKSDLDQLKGAQKSLDPDKVAAEKIQTDLDKLVKKLGEPNIDKARADAKKKLDLAIKNLDSATAANRAKLSAAIKSARAENDQLAQRPVSTDDNAGAQKQIDSVKMNLDADDLKLAPYVAGGSSAKSYADAVLILKQLDSTVLANVTVARFYSIVTEDCTGVYGGGRTTLVTVTKADNQANSVTINCATRAFVSEGFAFSSLPQRVFSSVATNTALPSAPSGSATPAPAKIVESTFSDVRPQPVVFLNVRLTAEESGDNGLYATFGLSVNSSPQAVTIDYLAGVSYALSRSLIGTFGVTLAPTTFLAPGYNVGDPAVAANINPPTVTRYRNALFLAITYGSH